MDTSNMKTQKKVPTMIILWIFVIISIATFLIWYPTLMCGYITKIWSISNNLPIHTREYQAFCEVANNNIEWAISILNSLKETKLNATEAWRVEYNRVLLSEHTLKKGDTRNSGSSVENDKNTQWRVEQTLPKSPENPEHNTITIESKVQYQGLDQDWIKNEQQRLIQQQLDRDTYINAEDEKK